MIVTRQNYAYLKIDGAAARYLPKRTCQSGLSCVREMLWCQAGKFAHGPRHMRLIGEANVVGNVGKRRARLRLARDRLHACHLRQVAR